MFPWISIFAFLLGQIVMGWPLVILWSTKLLIATWRLQPIFGGGNEGEQITELPFAS